MATLVMTVYRFTDVNGVQICRSWMRLIYIGLLSCAINWSPMSNHWMSLQLLPFWMASFISRWFAQLLMLPAFSLDDLHNYTQKEIWPMWVYVLTLASFLSEWFLQQKVINVSSLVCKHGNYCVVQTTNLFIQCALDTLHIVAMHIVSF